MKLHETSNYDLFGLHEFNRDVKRIKVLEASMRKHGFIPAYPLHVVKNGGGKFKIKAGHHRFSVAKKLGIPVYYVICDDSASIHELESATTMWSMSDYLSSWCRVGIQDYLDVRDYCTRTDIPLGLAASMFYGNQAGSGNHRDSFKAGTFKIRDRKHAQVVADIVMHMKSCGVDCYNANLFVKAISRCLYVQEFDPEVFKLKVKSHTHVLTKQANEQEYVNMIETLYNRQNKEKLPLAFLADAAAKARNAAMYLGKAAQCGELEFLPTTSARRAINE